MYVGKVFLALSGVSWIYQQYTSLHTNDRALDENDRMSLPRDKLFFTALLSKIVYRSPEHIEVLKGENMDGLKNAPLPENEYQLLSSVLKDQYDQSVFPLLIEDKKKDAQMYVWLSKSTKTLVLAYRGTSSKADMMTDVDLDLVKLFPDDKQKHKKVRVHHGFHQQFTSIEKKIIDICEKYRGCFNKIIHTGHSLGGGIATLSSVVFSDKFPDLDHECYTYGSPRPGNSAFQALYGQTFKSRKNSYRVINHHDAVTMTPMNFFYDHVHDALQFGDYGEVEVSGEMTGMRRVMQQLFHIQRDSIDDHMMSTYLFNIYRGLFGGKEAVCRPT
jgi:hypothetical protein